MSRRLALLLALCVLAAFAPALPAAAATVHEVRYVPTVGGAVIRVEINRDTKWDANGGQPVILTYSPYNTLNENANGETAKDGIATRYLPKGYARAVADVLGTRGSTGCWDYGGAAETQSGVDVVKFLAGKKADVDGNFITWSNGNVGMVGVSYEGTTANMVAATGIPELKAIVPIAAISRWYGYAYSHGVRYFLNSRTPTDEGFDTPLLFDVGFGDTVGRNPNDRYWRDTVVARTGECGLAEHTQHGYSRSPDYTDFWRARDYLQPAKDNKYRAAVMVVHGWQDYNVKQEEGTRLYEALSVDDPETPEIEGVPQKLLVMSQATHSGLPSAYQGLQDRFFDRYLRGVANGLDSEAHVHTLGRTNAGALTTYRDEASWPPPGTKDLALHIGRSFDCVPGVPCIGPVGSTGEYGTLRLAPQKDGGGWTHVNPGTISEEATLRDPLNRTVTTVNGQVVRGHGYYSLFHESAVLKSDMRIAGAARFDAYVNSSTAGQHLTPILVEVLPNGTLNLVERGFLNLDYRDGLGVAKPATGWMHANVEFLPQDYTFKAGSRIGIILQGSNTVWAVPGNPGTLAYANGPVTNVTTVGSRLLLPVVGLDDPAALLDS